MERLREYQRAARMSALQCFILDLEKRMKLAMIFHQMQNVVGFVGEEMFCRKCSRLMYFIIICDMHEYKGWTKTSLGLLYNV